MKHKPDPFVKRSTLRYLTRGETPSVRAVALQLHFGMVTALREGDGAIHATWKEVADWAGVSYASVKRAIIRLRQLGWLKEQSGHRIVFDYRRSCPVKKAQFETSPSIEVETLREGCTHPSTSAAAEASGISPSGADGEMEPDNVQPGKLTCEDQGTELVAYNRLVQPSRKPRMSPDQREALAILTAVPGMGRSGAVRAVRAGGPDLVGRVQRIVAAVQAMPVKPWRPEGLIVAAVSRPELGRKLIQDHIMTTKKPPSVPQVKRNDDKAVMGLHVPLSRQDVMRQAVRGWLDLIDPRCAEDVAWIIRTAGERGWSREELRSLPELSRALG